MRPVLPALLLLVACAHATDAPANRCQVEPALAPMDDPWVQLEPEGADPAKPGFARLLRFTIGESAAPGRASLIRMSNPETGEALYRGEKRSWQLRAEVEATGARVVGYAYTHPEKRPDLWVIPGRDAPVSRSHGPPPGDDLTRWACDLLLESKLGAPIRFESQHAGMALEKSTVRRLLGIKRTRRPIDIDRLIKGR